MSIRIPLAETILKHAKAYKKPSNEKEIIDGLKEAASEGRTEYWLDGLASKEEVDRLRELLTPKGYFVYTTEARKVEKKEVPFSWFRPFRFEYEWVTVGTGNYYVVVSLVERAEITSDDVLANILDD